MRVFFCVTVSMVHTVHDGVRAGIKEGRTLRQEAENIKEFFSAFTHGKHLMATITMQEKGLCKQGQKPVCQEKNKYGHIICAVNKNGFECISKPF